MTPLMQFLDTHINKPFKNGYTVYTASGNRQKASYEQVVKWVYTASGNRQKASYEQVVKWVYDVCNLVAADDLIIKGV